MAKASWIVSLEFSSDDGEGRPTTTRLSLSGSWINREMRPADECVALDMAALLRMLQASGHVVDPGGGPEAIAAFADGWS